MKQKVDITGASLHDPQIVFMDEPTVGLDPRSARLIKDLMIRNRDRGRTIFFSTHILEIAETMCDRVIIINKGRIATGYDADLTIVDMGRTETITNGWIQSKCGWTPFDGQKVKGWPVGTFVRGRRVMWQGALDATAGGAPVRFLEG